MPCVKARQRSIGEKDLVMEKECVKEEPAKELSPRKESCLVNIVEERLQIKGILHINCFGKCFEELFSYFLRRRKKCAMFSLN